MATPAELTAEAWQDVRRSARDYARDRYLAALLSPRAARDDLVALAAYMGEVARVPAVVSEPMMGEIRLQWWRDALAQPSADSAGHPVVDALRAAIARHGLPLDLVIGIAEARIADLYADPVADDAALQSFLDATDGAGFRLAARILAAECDDATGERVLTAAGRATGLTRLLLALPMHAARGRDPFPAGAVGATVRTRADTIAAYCAEARRCVETVRAGDLRRRPRLAAAVLPVALVEPYLRALRKAGVEAAERAVDIAPLTRVWRLWTAHIGRTV